LSNLFAADALLLGRVTYDGFKAAWPSMTDEKRYGTVRPIVISRTR
jgi:dihydrofolate reductase